MKLFSLLALLTSFSLNTFAASDLVCTFNEDKREVVVVVKYLGQGKSQMKIYQTVFGHAVQPQIVDVGNLPGTSGPVVAYGDENELQTLVMNLHNRNEKNEILGTYKNILTGQELPVACK